METLYSQKRVPALPLWRLGFIELVPGLKGKLDIHKTISYDRVQPPGVTNPLSASILHRIAAGDVGAVKACLDCYGSLVWSLARRFSPDPHEAEDAVQEIFIELWKKAKLFDVKRSSEKTFIAMLARRRLIDRLRRSYRQPPIEPLENMSEMYTEGLVSSDRQIDGKRALEVFKALKPEQQKCLRLSILAGLSHSEISQVMSLPMGTVKSHIRRGLTAIRERMAGKAAKMPRGRSK